MGRRGRQEDDWSDLEPIGPPINTPDREWAGTLTNDGKLLIIQRQHDLWMSTRRSWDDQWSQPQLIESLSTPRRENRPRLLADGRSMLFARDSENAAWRYDLYLARLVRKQTPGATAGSSGSAERTLTTKYALQFDGKDDYVATPVRFDVTQPLTVEAYVTVPRRPEWNQVVLCDANLGGFGLGPRENGKWRMDVQALGGQGSQRDEVGYVRVEANDEMEYGRRTHVAAVYDGRVVRLYIDGQVQTRGRAVEDLVPSTLPILIGANPNEDVGTAENFLGTIDEVRISQTACYTKDFTPAERLEADEHTLALYHFDEGAGDVLKDSSGNGHHGTIHGGTWVRVDEELKGGDSGAPSNELGEQ